MCGTGSRAVALAAPTVPLRRDAGFIEESIGGERFGHSGIWRGCVAFRHRLAACGTGSRAVASAAPTVPLRRDAGSTEESIGGERFGHSGIWRGCVAFRHRLAACGTGSRAVASAAPTVPLRRDAGSTEESIGGERFGHSGIWRGCVAFRHRLAACGTGSRAVASAAPTVPLRRDAGSTEESIGGERFGHSGIWRGCVAFRHRLAACGTGSRAAASAAPTVPLRRDAGFIEESIGGERFGHSGIWRGCVVFGHRLAACGTGNLRASASGCAHSLPCKILLRQCNRREAVCPCEKMSGSESMGTADRFQLH
ncbi:fermentation-respiration switch protein FrsA (DUF1100 family) [Puniceicoccus vermicola]